VGGGGERRGSPSTNLPTIEAGEKATELLVNTSLAKPSMTSTCTWSQRVSTNNISICMDVAQIDI
jgi:hypothetical protein